MSQNIECTECHDLVSVEARTITLPYVCVECQRAPELLEAMAPAGLKIEESDNTPCGCTPTDETTSLLLEDLSNQLEMARLEVNGLRLVFNDSQDAVERLRSENSQLHQNIDVLLDQKNKLAEENKGLAGELVDSYFENFLFRIANSKQIEKLQILRKELFMAAVRYRGLKDEFAYAAKRLFELAAELGKAEKSADVWRRRAEFAKRRR